MNVQVRFFASVREKLRCSETTWSLPPGARVGDLLTQLCERYPAITEMIASVSVAVNREYVPRDQVLAENDEVALIPPVSGGIDVRDR
jgi:molybdopterin converting factor subunit 1